LGALGIDGLRLIWQIINFLLLLFLLQRLLFKPVLRLMDQRAERIRSSVDEADRMRQLAEETRLANERALEEARTQAAHILENANRMAEQFRQSQMDAARKEAELFTSRARDEIRLERDQAIADVRHQAVDLAILAAGRVIEQQLNPDQHRQLVTQFLSQTATVGDGQR
jgi:F-type H+-transporting ATPase subunit b